MGSVPRAGQTREGGQGMGTVPDQAVDESTAEAARILDLVEAGHIVRVRADSRYEQHALWLRLGQQASRRNLVLERREGPDGVAYRLKERLPPDEFDQIVDLLAQGAYVRVSYGQRCHRRWVLQTVARRAHRRGLALEWRDGAEGWLLFHLRKDDDDA